MQTAILNDFPKMLTLATRGSPLALWQARFLKNKIIALCPDIAVNFLIVKTKGDRFQELPLAEIGGKGLFVKEIEQALLDCRADLAIHSMKDMPMHLPPGLKIGAVLERGPVEDMFLSFRYTDFSQLPEKAKLGTSSLRRQAQALARRPDLHIVPLRGNVATRISKLAAGQVDAIVLARAGLSRLNISTPHCIALPCSIHIPAAGQGALGVEYLAARRDLDLLLHCLDHPETRSCVAAERAFVRELNAGCHAPVGALARFENNTLHLRGFAAAANGSCRISLSAGGDPSEPTRLGRALALKTLKKAVEFGLNYPDNAPPAPKG